MPILSWGRGVPNVPPPSEAMDGWIAKHIIGCTTLPLCKRCGGAFYPDQHPASWGHEYCDDCWQIPAGAPICFERLWCDSTGCFPGTPPWLLPRNPGHAN